MQTPHQTLAELNSQFGLPGAVTFDAGNGGLPRALVRTPLAEADIYLNGAHVTHFQPAGERPVLFLSGKSKFEPGKAIRGGIPICFPWFGALDGAPAAPAHGFARTSVWDVLSTTTESDGSVTLSFGLRRGHDSSSPWPSAFAAVYHVTVGQSLKLSLTVTHLETDTVTFEEALHTYFQVIDVKQVTVTGLSNTPYRDKTRANAQFTEVDGPLHIDAETDRVYLDTTASCSINDPGSGRLITIKKTGSNTTVLWNPWIDKAKAMADFGDGEWPNMLCIETANTAESSITLKDGESHTMSADISIDK